MERESRIEFPNLRQYVFIVYSRLKLILESLLVRSLDFLGINKGTIPFKRFILRFNCYFCYASSKPSFPGSLDVYVREKTLPEEAHHTRAFVTDKNNRIKPKEEEKHISVSLNYVNIIHYLLHKNK